MVQSERGTGQDLIFIITYHGVFFISLSLCVDSLNSDDTQFIQTALSSLSLSLSVLLSKRYVACVSPLTFSHLFCFRTCQGNFKRWQNQWKLFDSVSVLGLCAEW